MLLRSTLGRNFQCRTALKAGLPSASIINVGHQIPKHRTIGSEAYEGDGRTTMTSLNEDQSGTRLLINSYSTLGFRLNNQMFVLGSIALFPRSLFQWNVQKPEDINEDSLSLFLKLEPKLDVLVIGYGERDNSNVVMQQLQKICQQHRLGLEFLPTSQACATFNFLNAELRPVAAALLPPSFIPNSDECYVGPAMERRFLIDFNEHSDKITQKSLNQIRTDAKQRYFPRLKKEKSEKNETD
ncbi:NADH dehydrogenase [ubiquinone] 1 alpha subcomplex assembly factor 3-like [Varroa jacobsoni]|uniref:NADH dehydrogenase [ubiquinone] 1 alpha subcomplex assembly factor 3-like n=1 Tax=Varroa jacobsoni TaxID=62625 RepID=UPI000BF75B3E|nr:NADH dehydrogenase [ubiquinone] 1 alpha subcomplex assembly factor 3-like [Varroa jacobsoni]